MLSLTMRKPPENFVTADPPTSSWSKPDRLTKSSFEEPLFNPLYRHSLAKESGAAYRSFTMMKLKLVSLAVISLLGLGGSLTVGCSGPKDADPATAEQTPARGWLSWRGPQQDGTTLETGLPEELSLEASAGTWSYQLAGRGTPVIADGRVYAMGYEGEGAELQELLVCLEAQTGKLIWEHRFTDFLTDIIYYRFGIGSPTVDPETGNVLCFTSAGLLNCFTRDGELLWQHSAMSEYGRLTFPNGRTGAPLIDGQLAIIHIICTSWGQHGPARDRFFAFDKKTGASVWSSTPGGPPKDSSFSFPVVAMEKGRRVLYAGLGGGHLVCVDLRTGEPLWRFQMAVGGINSSALLYKDTIIAIHGKENTDSSTIGRMIALKRGAELEPGKGPAVLGHDAEVWRNSLEAFTSSPILVGDRVYVTVHTGELCCVNAVDGTVLWHEKLAPEQIHASPIWGDGKLYVPMNNGSLHIIRPTDEAPKLLHKLQLEGNCLGAPAVADGRIYVHTTQHLYSFSGGTGKAPAATSTTQAASTEAATQLQIIPADILLRQGSTLHFRVRSLDANGRVVADPAQAKITWSGVPADGVALDDNGVMTVSDDAAPTAVVMQAAAGNTKGSARVRIVPRTPHSDDFEDALLQPHPKEEGVSFAPPRSYWSGAKLKWEIRDLDGNKVLAKTIDRALFQRTMSITGHPDMSNYTMQADVRSDGNRRSMSTVGIVNQRYLIRMKGNHQTLEVSSNMELFRKDVPFKWKAGAWYRLKSRVDVHEDGSGTIRAKAWPRDDPEPEGWTLEARHPHVHTHGASGLYGFSPQSRFRVYIDNLSVTSND